MTPAIEAEGLVKDFGETRALDGLDLVVEAGTIVSVLGPNGAGKTTAIRILTTLSPLTAGTARVAGYDVVTAAAEVRRHIGLTGQNASVDESLTGVQNLVMIGQLWRQPRRRARAAPTSSFSASRSPPPPGARSRRTRGECAAVSTSPRA